MDLEITPPGSTRSSGGFSKYHQGMPFCVLTTVVILEMRCVSCGASAVRPWALTPRKIDVDRVGWLEIGDDARVGGEIAIGGEDAEAVLLHGFEMRASGEQGDVGAGLGNLAPMYPPMAPAPAIRKRIMGRA